MDKNKMQKLNRRLRTLEKRMLEVFPLMRGSVVELGATCGNPKCRCTRGEKHMKIYFSLCKKGKTKIIYLGKSRESLARQYTNNYKILLEIVEEMTVINMELLKADAIKNDG